MFSLFILTLLADNNLFRRTIIPSEDPCPIHDTSTLNPLRLYRAEISGSFDKNGIDEARKKAATELENQLCKDVTSSRCEAIRRNIVPWGTGKWERNGLKAYACATVAIEEKHINYIDIELDMLDGEIRKLGDSISTTLSQHNPAETTELQLLPPVWANGGCSAREVGAHLLLKLKNTFSGFTVIDSTEIPDENTQQVRLELSYTDQNISFIPLKKSGRGWIPFETSPITFKPDLFQIQPQDLDVCPDVDELNISEENGMEVELYASGKDGIICEGEKIFPKVRISQEARLRVFSIEAENSYLVWPHEQTKDIIFKPGIVELPSFTAFYEGIEDSRLVVVAAPPDADLPAANMCKLIALPVFSGLPPEFGIATVSYSVMQSGKGLCSMRGSSQDEHRLEEIVATMEKLPLCEVFKWSD